MGGLGVSFLVRRARASWLLLACIAVTVLLATGLAAVLWTFAAAVDPAGALYISPATKAARSISIRWRCVTEVEGPWTA